MTDATTSAIVIREARLEDAPRLAGLLAELGYPDSPETIASRLAILDGTGNTVLVAWSGPDAVGLATLHITPVLHRPTPIGRITALVVTERSRGSGVGRALVGAAEQRLTDAGCALVEVTSNKKRVDAHEFYRRLGYDETSFRFKKDLPGRTP